MKKLLLLFAASLGCTVASTAASLEAPTEHWYDRDNWEVLGCSEQYSHSWGDKDLDAIIDGDIASYWHTQYTQAAGSGGGYTWDISINGTDDGTTNGHHFFIIDMNKLDSSAQYKISSFRYTPCQKGDGNGYCKEYEIYVLDNIDWMNNTSSTYHHSERVSALTDVSPVATGDFEYTASANQAAKTVYLDAPVNGHYVLFVLKTTAGTGGANKFASCAEFEIGYVEKDESEPDFIPEPKPLTAKLDRSNWDVMGCSQVKDNKETEGFLPYIIDGQNGTFWHAQWNATYTADGVEYVKDNAVPHYFVVDLDKDNPNSTFDLCGFDFLTRQDSRNASEGSGYANECELYVLDDITGLTHMQSATSHTHLNTFLAGKTPTWSGNLGLAYNNKALVHKDFETASGHYVLFVFKTTDQSSTTASNRNKYACCAEFNVYFEANPKYALYNDFIDKIEQWRGVGVFKFSNKMLKDACETLSELADNNEVSCEDMENAALQYEYALLHQAGNGVYVKIQSTANASHYLSYNSSNKVHCTTNAEHPNAAWQLEHLSDDRFVLRNHYTNTYMGWQTGALSEIALTDSYTDDQYYRIVLKGDGKVALVDDCTNRKDAGDPATVLNAIHHDTANTRIVKWSDASNASHWFLSLVSEGDTPMKAIYDKDLGYFTFKHDNGLSINTDMTAADHHCITLTAVNTAANTRGVRYAIGTGTKITASDLEATENGYKLELSSDLADGTYNMEIPAGFFKVNGKMTAPQNVIVQVADGNATGIEAVEAAGVEADMWFDLQGRRVVAPAHGIYLHTVGSKTVKVAL